MNKKVLATAIILTVTIFNSSNGYAVSCSPMPAVPKNCHGSTIIPNSRDCAFACVCYDHTGNGQVLGIYNYDMICAKDSTGKYLPATYSNGVLSCPQLAEAKKNKK